MKPTTLFALGALIATCSFASAQDETKKGPKGPPPAMMKEFDKDGDGKLSDDERAAMKTAMEAKHKMILEKYDANKDGKLDETERAAAIAAGEKLPMGHGGKKGEKGEKGGKKGAKKEDAPAAQ